MTARVYVNLLEGTYGIIKFVTDLDIALPQVPFMLDVLHLTVKRFTLARRGRQALPTAEGRMQEGRQRSFKAADAWCFSCFFRWSVEAHPSDPRWLMLDGQ